jgi:uncharacterized protein (DUF1015 family)
MSTVRPFAAIRPDEQYVARIAALPYDVYNRAEARIQAASDPMTFLRIDRPETNFPEDYDMYAPEVYQKAHDLLYGMIQEGSYITEEKSVYYIYELIMEGRSQTGIVACASIDDYVNGVIKKHENTREEKEQDRIRHVDICNAQTGPIFLAYRSRTGINEVVNRVKQGKPLYAFVSEDGIAHNVWVIDQDGDIARIQQEFADTDRIYIADGHHRAASAVKVGLKRRAEHPDYTGEEEFNYFLSVLFPDEELAILPYNRVVRDLNGLSEAEFLAEVEKVCKIEKQDAACQPDEKGCFGMYLSGQWYRLTIQDELRSQDPVKGLDVSLLQDYILGPILGIGDPRVDTRIDFVGGIRGLAELERRVSEDMQVAFSMYPTSIQELFQVADSQLLMPPKSTWFEPKLRSGIFIHEL